MFYDDSEVEKRAARALEVHPFGQPQEEIGPHRETDREAVGKLFEASDFRGELGQQCRMALALLPVESVDPAGERSVRHGPSGLRGRGRGA